MTEPKDTELTVEELLDIGCRMSQELLEFIEAGEERGNKMTASRSLLDEFNEMYQRSNLYWLNEIKNNDDCDMGILKEL